MSTITKPLQSAGLFVSAAPDAKPRDPTTKTVKRQQISPDMPRRLNEPAGQTRAGLLLGDGI